jgi:hypothetical protein|uniref:Uncharacterized protein n=1 Tax=Picea sitchensis TaxID=3332 RepID=A0A6B9XVT0_PICSI|nr:hypothetical protein Q903MT_gene3789 [Picea sitchensis]
MPPSMHLLMGKGPAQREYSVRLKPSSRASIPGYVCHSSPNIVWLESKMKMSDLNLVITVILSQVWVIMGWVRVWHKGKVL